MSAVVQTQTIKGYDFQQWPAYLATIAIGQTLSAAIDCQGLVLCGILFPATLSSSTISFNVSVDGTNFFQLNSTTSNTQLSYSIAESTWLAIDPTPFQGVRYLQLVMGTTEIAARTLYLSLKGKA